MNCSRNKMFEVVLPHQRDSSVPPVFLWQRDHPRTVCTGWERPARTGARQQTCNNMASPGYSATPLHTSQSSPLKRHQKSTNTCTWPTGNKNEPPHEKTNKMTWAPSEVSDQHGHLPSLIRVFAELEVSSCGQWRLILLALSWGGSNKDYQEKPQWTNLLKACK